MEGSSNMELTHNVDQDINKIIGEQKAHLIYYNNLTTTTNMCTIY